MEILHGVLSNCKQSRVLMLGSPIIHSTVYILAYKPTFSSHFLTGREGEGPGKSGDIARREGACYMLHLYFRGEGKMTRCSE